MTRLVVLTGMSGAGTSTALRALEDEGYFCIDNLPIVLLEKLVELSAGAGAVAEEFAQVALAVDAREGRYLKEVPQQIANAREHGIELSLLFFEASDDALERRFQQTRRRHPLAPGERISQGIRLERTLLQELRERADEVIDTTHLTPIELKQVILEKLSRRADVSGISVELLSFGYRFGLPLEADFVFDVRTIVNPYYKEDLRPLDGTDERVRAFVAAAPNTMPLVARVVELIGALLPGYIRQGKRYVTVAVGCTGGRHRSVAFLRMIAPGLAALPAVNLVLRDRDISR